MCKMIQLLLIPGTIVRKPIISSVNNASSFICGSPMENEHYSIAYYAHTNSFKAIYLRTSVKGGAYTCCIETSHIDATTQHMSAPPLTEVQRYSTLNEQMQSKYAME